MAVSGHRAHPSLAQFVPSALDELAAHEKQFFVFSSAGKPIYSYHGNEESLSSFMATAEALMSVAIDARSESLRYIRRGKCVVAFLDRSPICLVAISTLAEPPAVLRMQLALVHGQLTSLLTASALTSIFARSPGYDARRLLVGSETMLQTLIRSFTASPAATLGAYPSLPLPAISRASVSAALQTALAAARATFALISSGDSLVSIAAAGHKAWNSAPPLQQWDVLLLLNFLQSNQSLKQAETFTPICLPAYNPNGHLHACIQFMDAASGTALVLLVGGANPDFQAINMAKRALLETLGGSGALSAVQAAAGACQSDGCALTSLNSLQSCLEQAGLAASSLWHCVYKLSKPQQFVASNWAPSTSEQLQQDIIVAYSQLRAAMFDHAGEHVQGPLQTLRHESRPKFSLVALSGPSSELYLALDPLVGKAEAVNAAGHVLRTLSNRHQHLFF